MTAQAEHTPKPWAVEDGVFVVSTVTEEAVCALVDSNDAVLAADAVTDEDRANVALMVAAPDMLEALEALTAWADYMGGWEAKPWTDAKAAIARAKGAA